MSIFLSPNVFIEETDLSQVTAAISTSIAAVVGASNKGPANERKLVTTDKEFIDLFGEPDTSVGFMHYSALAFLKDGRQLYVTRVVNGALNSGIVVNQNTAPSATTALVTGVADPSTFSFTGFADGVFGVFAENPGTWGNNLKIKIDEVDTANNVFAIQVLETQNGVDVLQESWTVSRQTKTDGFGEQLFLEDKINGNSRFIRVKNNAAIADTVLPKHSVTNENIGTGDGVTVTFADTLATTPVQRGSVNITVDAVTVIDDSNGNLSGVGLESGTINYTTGQVNLTFTAAPSNTSPIEADYFFVAEGSFTQGVNGSAIGDSQATTGWDLYASKNDIDVRILINAGLSSVAVQTKMKDICEARKDCIAILDVPTSEQAAGKAVNWRKNTQNFNSSYTALYSPNLKVFDQFNDLIVNVPPSGYVAGVYARTDNVSDPWFPPAGFRRGLLSVQGVATKYTQGQYDTMYPQGINAILNFPGQGIPVWGDKTQQSTASALDRVNVRRLLIVLENSIATSLRSDVFELNTEFLRLQVKQKIDAFMRGVQSRAGVTEFRTVVDETNNPPEVIDANQLNVDIYIKPTRSINFIKLQSIITRSGAQFDELIATGGNLA